MLVSVENLVSRGGRLATGVAEWQKGRVGIGYAVEVDEETYTSRTRIVHTPKHARRIIYTHAHCILDSIIVTPIISLVCAQIDGNRQRGLDWHAEEPTNDS